MKLPNKFTTHCPRCGDPVVVGVTTDTASLHANRGGAVLILRITARRPHTCEDLQPKVEK